MAKRTLAGELAVKPNVPIQPAPETVQAEPPKARVPDEDIRATTIKLRMPVLLALKTMALRQRRPVNDLLVEAVDDFLRLHGQEAA